MAMTVQRRRSAARGWLVLTSLGLGTLIAGLVVAGFWTQRRLASEIEKDPAPLASHERLVRWTIDAHLAELERELLRLSKRADLRAAVVAGDRNELLEQIRPPLNRLGKAELQVSRITVYSPAGNVYLRAHAPESYGENAAASRPLVAQVIQTRQILRGLEAENGIPRLWVATPLYDRGQFLGVLEMGSSLAPVVNAIRAATGGEVAVLLGTKTPEVSEASRDALFSKLAPNLHRQAGLAGPARQVVAAQGKTYAASLIPLKGFSERDVGILAIVTDATGIAKILRESNLTTVVISFVGFAVAVVLLSVLTRKLDKLYGNLQTHIDQLKALGEVSQAISSTLELQTVLSTIVGRATQLARMDAGVIYEYDEQREVFVPRATERLEAEIVQAMVAVPVRKGEGATGRLAEVPEPIQLPDIFQAPAESGVRDALVRAGYRSLLAVPLVREDHLIGALTVIRRRPGEFAPEVIDLLRTFATQSALAIQNARLFREIEEKGRELEAASRHKSEFLSNMSHELRTPLNAIIGFSEVLGDRMFGELTEKQEEYLKDIMESGQHLLSLINDILDLSKIEAGRMELELAEFDLPQAIDNALTLVRERAGRRGIALHQAVDERLGESRGDARKVKQVLLNLLSNALKFTPEGGRIDISARLRDGSAEISVADTGVGIAPEDQEAVFEAFRQVGTAAKRVEGTGLGLALSRKFVELHGGRIWVKSQVGVGSTFTFTVPMRLGE